MFWLRASVRWTRSPSRSTRAWPTRRTTCGLWPEPVSLATRRDGTRIYYRLASERVAELWSALRDVAAEHVAGLERLAAAYLGDRDGLEVVDRAELAVRWSRGDVVVVDVRPPAEFAAGHIAGARSVPLSELRRQLRALPKDVDVVAYCRGPYCVYADDAVRAPVVEGLPSPPVGGRVPGMETGRSAGRRRRVREIMPELAVDARGAARAGAGQVPRGGRRPGRRLPLPHRTAARRPARLRPGGRRRRCRTGPSSRSPGSGTRSRCGRSGRGARRRRRLRRRVRLVRRRRPGRPDGPGRRCRHDRRDARSSRAPTATALGFDHVEFRDGLAEALPVEDGWADVVISNGVINLCADKRAVFDEIHRVLRAGRVAAVRRHRQRSTRCRPRRCATSTCGPVELPVGCPVRAGNRCSKTSGSSTCGSAPAVDTFGGAGGEANARAFEVYGYAFLARKPN